MRRTKIRRGYSTEPLHFRVTGFSLLESLIVLFLTTSLVLLLSSQIGFVFSEVRSQLFFLEFEHFYRESQQLSQVKGRKVSLIFSQGRISNGYDDMTVPSNIVGPTDFQLNFEESGANHSLAKLDFKSDSKTVSYQLFLGSGKYKKTEN